MGAPLPVTDGHTHRGPCYDPIEPCPALLAEPLARPEPLPTGASGTVCLRCRTVAVAGSVQPLALANGCHQPRAGLRRCGGTLVAVSMSITYPDSPFYRDNT